MEELEAALECTYKTQLKDESYCSLNIETQAASTYHTLEYWKKSGKVIKLNVDRDTFTYLGGINLSESGKYTLYTRGENIDSFIDVYDTQAFFQGNAAPLLSVIHQHVDRIEIKDTGLLIVTTPFCDNQQVELCDVTYKIPPP